MPSPPKKRRNAIGPNSKNRSSKRCGSVFAATRRARGSVEVFGRGNAHTLAAAAGGRLVRVVEHEAGAKLFAHEIHLGSNQEEDRLRFDEDLHALVLEPFVEGLASFGVVHALRHTGAAAVGHAD